MAPTVGLEPTTARLTAECSTIELSWSGSPPSTRTRITGTKILSSTIKLEVSKIGVGYGKEYPFAIYLFSNPPHRLERSVYSTLYTH